MVAIYDEDLSDSPRDPVTLIFPGNQAGSSPKRVVPERVGTRTLIFKTPGINQCQVELGTCIVVETGSVGFGAEVQHLALICTRWTLPCTMCFIELHHAWY